MSFLIGQLTVKLVFVKWIFKQLQCQYHHYAKEVGGINIKTARTNTEYSFKYPTECSLLVFIKNEF